jgi:formate dehydrogenase (NADP+) beta subunit
MLMQTLTRGSFARPSSSIIFNTGGWRTSRPEHRPQRAPCASACPAGENPQAYLAKVGGGNLRAAWETLVKANPLPAITGRVCHHPCEGGCNRGGYDEPLAIHSVERFLGDRAIAEAWNYPLQSPPASAPEVAIVGAGPAGLSAAYHLTSHGYRAIIFESQPEAGGLLRSALPPYRLPRQVRDAEIERLLAIGIDFRPSQRIGRDISMEELCAGFRAVFLAPGTSQHRAWSIDGATPGEHRNGIDLLKEWISIGAMPPFRRVAIVGGGNTAIDLARVIKFAGASEVHVITFQSIPGPGIDPIDAMTATPREIRQAIEEGVTIHDRRGVSRLIMRGKAVVGVELVHMQELPGAAGTRQPVAFEGTETVLMVDQVIPAIGQVVDSAGLEKILGRNAFFAPDEFGRLDGHPGVFAGGDARAAGGSVSGAIGDGRRAAIAIHSYLEGLKDPQSETENPIGLGALNLNYFEHAGRSEAPILKPDQRSVQQEIEGALSRDQIDNEARRCFSCGECMSCDNCWTLCPDNSVLKVERSTEDNRNYVFDYDHCKGCGICAHECPVGFIAMVDES